MLLSRRCLRTGLPPPAQSRSCTAAPIANPAKRFLGRHIQQLAQLDRHMLCKRHTSRYALVGEPRRATASQAPLGARSSRRGGSLLRHCRQAPLKPCRIHACARVRVTQNLRTSPSTLASAASRQIGAVDTCTHALRCADLLEAWQRPCGAVAERAKSACGH